MQERPGKPAGNQDSERTLRSSPRILDHSHLVACLPLVVLPETAGAFLAPPRAKSNTESSLGTHSAVHGPGWREGG